MNYTVYELIKLNQNPDILYYDIIAEYDNIESAREWQNIYITNMPGFIYKIYKTSREIVE